MERTGRPRRRPEAPSAPTTLTEITRRYYACAVALAKAMGVPLSETFLREHRESISCCFIEAGRAGVRLPPAVQLPPLHMSARDNHLAAADNHLATGDNGDAPDFAPPPNGHPALSQQESPPADPSANGAVTENVTAVTRPTTIPTEAGELMCSGMPPAPEAPTTGDPALSVITTVAELPTRIPAGLQLPCAEALIADLRPAQLALLCGKVGLKALAEKSLEPLHVALLAERARRFARGQRAETNGHGA
jgi:hypothetical protein